MSIVERLQNGDTLAQAWLNNAWELKWSMLHHTEWSLEGTEKTNGEKKGKKRGKNDDDADEDPTGKSWQSTHGAMRSKYQRLVEKGSGGGSCGKGSWNGGGGSWGGGSWGTGYEKPWENGKDQTWPNKTRPPVAKGTGKYKCKQGNK